MRKYTLFQIPMLSFYSTDLYKDVALNKKGTGFGYLFLLLAFCWLLLSISLDFTVDSVLDKQAPAIISQVPEISIIDGHAYVDAVQPYYINDPETGGVIAILDTTGKITSLEGQEAVVLLTEKNVIVKENEVETRAYELSEIVEFRMNQGTLTHWVEMTKSYLCMIIYPFALLSSFIYRIIQLLFYAVFGLVFASALKVELDYQQSLRLSVIAVTPAIIINTVLWSFSTALPMGGFLYFILTMTYLYLGVKAIGETGPEEAEAKD